jgi:hypothetical protein
MKYEDDVIYFELSSPRVFEEINKISFVIIICDGRTVQKKKEKKNNPPLLYPL